MFTRACSLQFERQPLLLDARRGPDDDRARISRRAVPPAGRSGQPDAAPGRMGRHAARGVVPAAAPHARAHRGCDVLRRPREQRRIEAPLARPARRTRAFRRRAAAACAAAAEPRRARAGVEGEPRSERTAQQREQLDLFVKLCSRIDPEFKPLARRGERIPASGAVDAIVGFDNISGFLCATTRRCAPTRIQLRPQLRATRWISRYSGARGSSPTRSDEVARRRLAAFAAPGGPWEMKDMSVSGFRLHRADEHRDRGHAQHARRRSIGAARTAGSLGIVRRMRRLSADNAEIGLQLIANTLASGRSDRAAQGARRRLLGRRRPGSAVAGAGSVACSSRTAGARASRRCSR